MAQTYPAIDSSDTLRDSRVPILDRDDANKSNFSGTSFPTVDLLIGMGCYRTDQAVGLNFYVLTAIAADVWTRVPYGDILAIANGGTGASSASGARTALGLGALAILNTVGNSEIVDGSIDTNKLGPDAVTNAKLADNAVQLENMAANSVDTDELVNESVTQAKLDSGIVLGFEAGTIMLFQQTAAPTGWTKSVTHNDKALRIVSGTVASGGNNSFSSAFGSGNKTVDLSGNVGSHVLTVAEMPSHTHSFTAVVQNTGSILPSTTTIKNVTSGNTGSTGGDGAHNHPLDGTATLDGLDVQFVDCIIASKD